MAKMTALHKHSRLFVSYSQSIHKFAENMLISPLEAALIVDYAVDSYWRDDDFFVYHPSISNVCKARITNIGQNSSYVDIDFKYDRRITPKSNIIDYLQLYYSEFDADDTLHYSNPFFSLINPIKDRYGFEYPSIGQLFYASLTNSKVYRKSLTDITDTTDIKQLTGKNDFYHRPYMENIKSNILKATYQAIKNNKNFKHWLTSTNCFIAAIVDDLYLGIHPTIYSGLNLYGRALMVIRDDLLGVF